MKGLLVKSLSILLLAATIAPTALAASPETTNEVTAKDTQSELIKAHREREWYDRESRRFREEPDALKRREKREWYDRESRRFREEPDTLKRRDKEREWYDRESHR